MSAPKIIDQVRQIIPVPGTACVVITVDKYPRGELAEQLDAVIRQKWGADTLVVFLKKDEKLEEIPMEVMAAHGWVKFDPDMMQDWKRKPGKEAAQVVFEEDEVDEEEDEGGEPHFH